jgi:hypothetical protein
MQDAERGMNGQHDLTADELLDSDDPGMPVRLMEAVLGEGAWRGSIGELI